MVPYDDQTTYYTRDTLIEKEQLKLKDIILEAVHTYGKEKYSNIIINDLDEAGLELMEYRGDQVIYLLYNEFSNQYTQLIIDGKFKVYIKTGENTFEDPYIEDIQFFNTGINDFNNSTKFYLVAEEGQPEYSATKIEFGDVIGYRLTDLTYPGDLISNIGESLASILDKIKNMLGAFEYFYDIDGKFVFQAKKIYSNKSWNSLISTDYGVFAKDAIEDSPYSYSFENANLIQRFTNTPAINSIKNDYSIWGTRKGAGDAELPIHARYAIDKKPTKYTSISVIQNDEINEVNEMRNEFPELYPGTDDKYTQTGKEYTDAEYDWREIIYQMALDYYKYGQWSKFTEKLIEANPEFFEGTTGYEQYYIDLQGFWRQLYDPTTPEVYTEDGKYIEGKFIETAPSTDSKAYSKSEQKINNKDIYKVYSTGTKYYLKPSSDTTSSYSTGYYWQEAESTCNYFKKPNLATEKNDTDNYSSTRYFWNKDVVNNPHLLNFWMDFYEGDDSLQQYAVSEIGQRSIVVNNSKIVSLFFKEVPNIILTSSTDERANLNHKAGYSYMNISPNEANLFTISGRGKSANEEMTELFNKHSYCSESVSVSLVPIYYLEPNTIIYINDKVNNIVGKYEVTKLTIPLTYNGMMSLTGTKIIDIV